MSLLVGVQTRHFLALGVSSQAMLAGPGITDSHLTQGQIDGMKWTYPEALEHCRKDLRDFLRNRGASAESSRSATILEAIEASDFAHLGKPCIAPSGLTAQEILIQAEPLAELIDQARSQIWPFLVLKEIGISCLKNGNLDLQPSALQRFLASVLLGQVAAPTKVPKSLRFQARDALIRALVRGLESRGIKPTRNDASPPLSGCDVVAEAARSSGISGLTSYQRVKDIYLKG